MRGGVEREREKRKNTGGRRENQVITKEKERLALRNKVSEEKHSEIYRQLREGIGMKTYLRGPMDCAKKLKL